MNWRLYREACHDAGLSESNWNKEEITVCVCEWKDHKVVSMCGAHYEAAQRHADYEVKLAINDLLEACKTTWLYLNRINMPFALEAREYLAKAIAKAEGHDDGDGNSNKQGQREGE